MIFSCSKLQNVPRYIKMYYFRGSSLKTVPPACNLTRHCLLFQSVAHFSRSVALSPESLLSFRNHCSLSGIIALFPEALLTFLEVLLTFSKINKVRYFYQTFLCKADIRNPLRYLLMNAVASRSVSGSFQLPLT